MNRQIVNLLSIGLLLCLPLTTFAAEELPASSPHVHAFIAPADRWAIRLEVRRNDWNQQYNNDGNPEDLGAVFDKTARGVFSSRASLDTTAFDSRASNRYSELTIGYGINDGINDGIIIGALIPLALTQTKVSVAVNNGNVGFDPGFNPSLLISGSNVPFAPVGGGATPMSSTAYSKF